MVSQSIIGVIGAGAMGRGIVQLFVQAGHRVYCYDQAEGAAVSAIDFVISMIERGVQKGRFTREQADAISSAMYPAVSLDDLADCQIVVEAIVEDLQVKRQLFAELESVVGSDTILASNTSSLMVADIAAGCHHPERVAGLHFFNPVPLMKVAEVITAVRTDTAVASRLIALVESTGHRAVVAADQPGFLVNHAGRGLYTEGLRLLEEQVASVQDLDIILREAAGFRMGPFELLDLTGLDVSGKVMESIYEQFQHEPRYRPSSLIPPRVAAGLYGRKNGEGWYHYVDNEKQVVPEAEVPSQIVALSVWIHPLSTQHTELQSLIRSSSAVLAQSAAVADLLIIQPWGQDATSFSIEHHLDARKCVAVDPLSPLDTRVTLMLTVATLPRLRDAAHAILSSKGASVTVINDSPGFVVQRVLACIVNIASTIAQRGIASVRDIEDAVKLGLGYPHGPLAWGDLIGGRRILEILENMYKLTGDPRYRPSLWLVRRASLGLSLLTAEAHRSGDEV